MTLGASLDVLREVGIVLLVGMGAGCGYLILHLIRLTTKNAILCFIYDFVYVIIVGGVFVMVLFHVNSLDVKYYHLIALIVGILLSGALPSRYLARYDDRIRARLSRMRERWRESRLYRMIKR